MSFLTSAAERRRIAPAQRDAVVFSKARAIDYPHVRQRVSNWCWAACLAMVAEAKGGVAVDPCSIVRDELGIGSCCDDPTPDECNQPLALDSMTLRLQMLSATTQLEVPAGSDWLGLQFMIAGVVVAMWRWNDASAGPGYHYVVIAGALPGSADMFQLHDPRFGDVSYVPYDALVTAGGSGTWEFAWVHV